MTMTMTLGPKTPEEAEIFAVETFIADTQLRLHQLMEAKGVTRSQLAERLGVRKSRVTAMFGGNPNLTLVTLARVLHALDETAVLSSPTIDRRLAQLSAAPAEAMAPDAEEAIVARDKAELVR